jgi:prepilin-type N-terminal cleavage/methylation domain-containing protein
MRKQGFTLIELMIVIAIIAIIAAIAIPNLLSSKMSANETSAMATLNVFKSVEAVWMQGDTDRNGTKDFWTYDVSCFNRMFRADGTTLVAAIDISVAKADIGMAANDVFDVAGAYVNTRPTLTANKGYFYKAILNSDNTPTAYNINTAGTNAVAACNNFLWGFCAAPASYNNSGIKTYIINQAGTTYSRDIAISSNPTVLTDWDVGGSLNAVDTWPGLDPTTTGWTVD